MLRDAPKEHLDMIAKWIKFSQDHRETLQNAGLIISGTSPDGTLVETVELADHPFYVGVQYHPEFKSRPNKPHPLFVGMLREALAHRTEEGKNE